jgi:hypothetical protein
MRVECFFVAELLQRLEQQGGALRPHAVEVAAALSRDQYPAALEASTELTRVLDMFVTTTEVLQDHVVAHDGMGKPGGSFGELALRARGMVVIGQFGLLRDAFRDPAVQARTRGWFVDPVQGITDVDAFVRERLSKIHAIWMPYREGEPQLPGMTDSDRASLYRITVRVAGGALRELRDQPPLARFLEKGVAATDLSEIQLACRQIDAVLCLHIDVEGRQLLPKPRPVHATNGASEKR